MMQLFEPVILGLGCNKGDRAAQLQQAVGLLSAVVRGMRCSRVLESPALLPEHAPTEWDMPFYNMVVSGTVSAPPQALLAQLKAIEAAMGRVARGHWGPREIDIDILAMGEMVLSEPGLTVPHPELLNRGFALLPLAELAPDWRYPVSGAYCQWLPNAIAEDKGYETGENLRDKGMLIHA